MFTWICPECGREVPPAYNECPDCAAKTAPAGIAPPSPAVEPAPPPPPQAAAPPRQPYAPPQAVYEPPRQAAARPRPAGPALPTWLLAVLFSLAFLGLVFGVYWLVGALRGSGGSSQATPAASVEIPVAAPGAKTNPYQKYIEISGLRFAEDPKNKDKTLVKFVITNHADADIAGLSGNVAVLGRGQKAGGEALAAFSFTTSLGPAESKDLTTPLTTKLKPYELPDWQYATADLQITAPGGASGGSPAPR